jgi:YD repeat-containing protein
MWLEFKLSLVFILPNPIAISPTNIGKIIKQTDANNHTTTSVYDIQGHLTDSYDAIGHRTSHQTYYNDDRLHKTPTDKPPLTPMTMQPDPPSASTH